MATHPVSPNTVPANALHHAEDALAPRTLTTRPERIVLVVGTRINGASHIGTSLMQSLAFAMAARLRDRFGLPTEALSSAPVQRTVRAGHRPGRRPPPPARLQPGPRQAGPARPRLTPGARRRPGRRRAAKRLACGADGTG
ncbi:hypothetical protein [Streptomyces sp. NPDC056921]|uniref:hypothetical protein n=1 Tax=Streptomyces sp. NPDC056921 TaxID=3345966 RepID=UPI003629EFB2